MRNTGLFSSTLLLFLLAAGCAQERRHIAAPIEREKFMQLYVDILIAGELGRLAFADSSRVPLRSPGVDSIFTKHGVTEDQVKETVREYSRDLRTWKEFYDEVIQRLEKIQ